MIVQQTKLTQELNKREKNERANNNQQFRDTGDKCMLVQQIKLTQELNKGERKTKGQTIINSSETQSTSACFYNKPN
jgi:hypothetical protein